MIVYECQVYLDMLVGKEYSEMSRYYFDPYGLRLRLLEFVIGSLFSKENNFQYELFWIPNSTVPLKIHRSFVGVFCGIRKLIQLHKTMGKHIQVLSLILFAIYYKKC
jgi:hypothetical protein